MPDSRQSRATGGTCSVMCQPGLPVSSTVRKRRVVSVCPLRLQVTVTGQVPGVVRVPTSHLHVTAPAVDAVFGSMPWAVDGPDL